MQIEQLRPEQAETAALLHHQGQLHTFLGRMGQPFLVALYRELVSSPWGFGLAAMENGRLVGVATATSSIRGLFGDLAVRRWSHLLGPTLAALWRRPALILSALETLTYPRKVGDLQRGEFELLFIGIAEEWRGRGAGSLLMDALVEKCQTMGCRHFHSLVEEINEVSNALHLRRGFRVKKKIVLYGRPMTLYTLPLLGRETEPGEMAGGGGVR
ncbi:MAG: GNAT family N-acetyltransferase [Chloroflexi bacterium]|nr:GNAT family N-acetyltransferase [Chloroflexota bacterium]